VRVADTRDPQAVDPLDEELLVSDVFLELPCS
jgi:hypothetical protein